MYQSQNKVKSTCSFLPSAVGKLHKHNVAIIWDKSLHSRSGRITGHYSITRWLALKSWTKQDRYRINASIAEGIPLIIFNQIPIDLFKEQGVIRWLTSKCPPNIITQEEEGEGEVLLFKQNKPKPLRLRTMNPHVPSTISNTKKDNSTMRKDLDHFNHFPREKPFTRSWRIRFRIGPDPLWQRSVHHPVEISTDNSFVPELILVQLIRLEVESMNLAAGNDRLGQTTIVT